MVRVVVEVDCPEESRQAIRPVFVLGPVADAPSVVEPTPQFRQFPLLGEVMAAFQLRDDQQVDVTFKPVDKKGNPAPIDPSTYR